MDSGSAQIIMCTINGLTGVTKNCCWLFYCSNKIFYLVKNPFAKAMKRKYIHDVSIKVYLVVECKGMKGSL